MACTSQRVTAALFSASAVSADIMRRKVKAGTAELSAASCRRRDGVSPSESISPTTAASPACFNPSSIASRTVLLLRASTKMIRSGSRPTQASPGAKRSRLRTHHKTGPGRRASMPAMNSEGAAPKLISSPTPFTSCSAPSASPPSGSRSSISTTRKGSIGRVARVGPSQRPMRARRSCNTSFCGVVSIRSKFAE